MEQKMKSTAPTTGKMSYGDLETLAGQLSQQNKEMYTRLTSVEQGLAIKRIELLFKVIEYASQFTEIFVKDCIEELEVSLSIPKEEESTNIE